MLNWRIQNTLALPWVTLKKQPLYCLIWYSYIYSCMKQPVSLTLSQEIQHRLWENFPLGFPKKKKHRMMKSIRLIFDFESEEKFNVWERGKLGDMYCFRDPHMELPGFDLSSTTSEDWKIRKKHKKSCPRKEFLFLFQIKPVVKSGWVRNLTTFTRKNEFCPAFDKNFKGTVSRVGLGF